MLSAITAMITATIAIHLLGKMIRLEEVGLIQGLDYYCYYYLIREVVEIPKTMNMMNYQH